ncbi:MAG: hypothetical protein HQK87_05475 [Nitrospinae bacterium]|nr:hypothetical protein [Nitrospinota bacterium]
MWLHRNELTYEEKRLRSLYDSLREDLSRYLIEFALVDSFNNYLAHDEPYVFVEKRELKPRAKVVEKENPLINSFIVIFAEGALPPDMKKNLRHFDSNKVTKENLAELKLTGLNVADRFQKQQKYFETTQFYVLLRSLLKIDYALLIQRDLSVKNKNRYSLSHYHVRIDWLLDAAAEALGKEMRYISKDLYEKGDEYAQLMVEKLFEYYSFHHSVSGRRTAAMLAMQLLRQGPSYGTVFVSSSESRTLTRLSEKGVSKYILLPLDAAAISHIEGHPNGDPEFRRKFLIHEKEDGGGVVVFQVVYAYNEHSKPPIDGKLRDLKADVSWLRVRNQLLVPNFSMIDTRPIRYQVLYDQADPLS